MSTSSWCCAGCTNLCHQIYNGEVGTYYRVIYDQPKNKGTKWIGEHVTCLDYTTDPKAEDRQVRVWSEPKFERTEE